MLEGWGRAGGGGHPLGLRIVGWAGCRRKTYKMWGFPSFAPLSLGALTSSSFIQGTAGSCLCRPPPIIFCSLSSPKLSPSMPATGDREDQSTLPIHLLFPELVLGG